MKYFKPFQTPEAPVFRDVIYDIRSFGATEDMPCTDAIRRAIDTCVKEGGGMVLVPEGSWESGPIHLKSNVNLHFKKGSFLKFSPNFNDYLPVVYGILAGNRCYSPSHLLYAYQCKNIALTGEGVLDGNGAAWWPLQKHKPGMVDLVKAGKTGRPVSTRVYDKPEYGVRPRMLQFVECENVLLEGVSFQNSPSWTVHPAWCKNIIVRHIRVTNPTCGPNTDGINLESCKRGLVEHCHIDTGDDILCLKAGRDNDAWEVGIPCEDIEIRNCTAPGGHGAITIGSETSASIRNAYIHDCSFGRCYSAIRIKTMQGRGGVVENIDYENIQIESAIKECITMTLRYNEESLDDHTQEKHHMPTLRNIAISKVQCEKANRGIDLLGEDGFELENISIKDVSIKAFEPLRAEHVKNLEFQGVNLGYSEKMDDTL